MKRLFDFTIMILAAALLCACASLGLETPQTFEERLLLSYGTVAAVRESAAQLREAKAISLDDAVNVQKQADNARAGLDIAKGLKNTDLKAADQRLVATIQILTALQAYLASKGAAK